MKTFTQLFFATLRLCCLCLLGTLSVFGAFSADVLGSTDTPVFRSGYEQQWGRLSYNIPNQEIGSFVLTTSSSGGVFVHEAPFTIIATSKIGVNNMTLVDESGRLVAGPFDAVLDVQSGVQRVVFTDPFAVSKGASVKYRLLARVTPSVDCGPVCESDILVRTDVLEWKMFAESGEPVMFRQDIEPIIGRVIASRAQLTAGAHCCDDSWWNTPSHGVMWTEVYMVNYGSEPVRLDSVTFEYSLDGISPSADLMSFEVNVDGVRSDALQMSTVTGVGYLTFSLEKPVVIPSAKGAMIALRGGATAYARGVMKVRLSEKTVPMGVLSATPAQLTINPEWRVITLHNSRIWLEGISILRTPQVGSVFRVSLNIHAAPGQKYTIEASTGGAGGAWVGVQDGIMGASGVEPHSFLAPTTGTQIYRVRALYD